MKKLIFTLFISIISINFVYADTYRATGFYDNFSDLETIYTTYSTNIDYLKNYYDTNLSSQFNFYFISYQEDSGNTNSNITLYATNDNTFSVYSYQSNYSLTPNNVSVELYNSPTGYYSISYYINTNTYKISPTNDFSNMYAPNFYTPNSWANSIIDASDFTFTENISFDRVVIPSYSLNDFDIPEFQITEGQLYPTFKSLYTGTYDPTPDAVYTEVNLSSYDYIVLSLKNYNQQPFTSDIYTLGELCLTPVYNYGMTQKNNVITGYKTPACSVSYSSFTPVRVYILATDLSEHAVYYIKQSSNSSINKVKIDTNVFDISYISSNVNTPEATVNGRSYPIIPFSQLTDSANLSSTEGYISGQVCAIGDINCQADAMGMDISDLFSHPLTLLQSIWTSITSVFTIIASFIAILPPTLQIFLYTSFMLGIILGIIKIIL